MDADAHQSNSAQQNSGRAVLSGEGARETGACEVGNADPQLLRAIRCSTAASL
jgi:hypothetical protein